jgi:hypothetical protein
MRAGGGVDGEAYGLEADALSRPLIRKRLEGILPETRMFPSVRPQAALTH